MGRFGDCRDTDFCESDTQARFCKAGETRSSLCPGGSAIRCCGRVAVADSECPLTAAPTPATTVQSLCGNEQLDAGEQCDGTQCCTAECQFAQLGAACDVSKRNIFFFASPNFNTAFSRTHARTGWQYVHGK